MSKEQPGCRMSAPPGGIHCRHSNACGGAPNPCHRFVFVGEVLRSFLPCICITTDRDCQGHYLFGGRPRPHMRSPQISPRLNPGVLRLLACQHRETASAYHHTCERSYEAKIQGRKEAGTWAHASRDHGEEGRESDERGGAYLAAAWGEMERGKD